MKSPALYLLEVFFCSGMLLAFYRLLLVRRVAFVHCRRYLLAAVVLSLVIPALNIPLYPARTVVYPLPLVGVVQAEAIEPAPLPMEVAPVAEAPVPEHTAAPIDWRRVSRMALGGVYLLTVAGSLGLFTMHLLSIRRLRRRSQLTPGEGYTLAENPAVVAPFSFLKTVFLGEGYQGRRREIVLCHETSHVRHRHTAERILVELVRCFFWFNPFVWMAQRWLSEVQEWEADRDVLQSGYDLTEYRTIIFRQLFGYNPDMACGLNHSFTKNRFAMMTQFKQRRFGLLRLCAAVPVVAGMMMLCSFTTRQADPAPQSEQIAAQGLIPGLEKLKPVSVHILLQTNNLADGKEVFNYIEYLPVDDSKYLYAGDMRVTDLRGKDITDWAHKHYFVRAKNPAFFIDGVQMSKDRYMLYEVERRQTKERDIPSIYVGSEVTELLGDPSVDALVVIWTEPYVVAKTALLPNLHCPLQSTSPVGAYGQRTKPVSGIHTGVDIAAPNGTPITAAADGTITAAGLDGGRGNCIRIAHADGYSTTYAHLNAMRVKAGDRVKGGDVIGTVGSTGRSTGPHLHFEMAKDGVSFDPGRVFDFSASTLRVKPIDTQSTLTDSFTISGKVTDVSLSGEYQVYTGNLIVTSSDKADWLIKCDSVRFNRVDRALECFGDILYENEGVVYVSEYCRILVNPQGGLSWETRNTIGTPRNEPLIRLSANGDIWLRNEKVTLDELPERIEAYRKMTPGGIASVAIYPAISDTGLKMGLVTDLKEALRKANVQKVRYSDFEGSPQKRVLTPEPATSEQNGVTVIAPKVKQRNLFQVLISGSGVVSMMATRDTPYSKYVEAQRLIQQGFADVRELAAKSLLGVSSYDGLSAEDKAVVDRAVPLMIMESEPRNIASGK